MSYLQVSLGKWLKELNLPAFTLTDAAVAKLEKYDPKMAQAVALKAALNHYGAEKFQEFMHDAVQHKKERSWWARHVTYRGVADVPYHMQATMDLQDIKKVVDGTVLEGNETIDSTIALMEGRLPQRAVWKSILMLATDRTPAELDIFLSPWCFSKYADNVLITSAFAKYLASFVSEKSQKEHTMTVVRNDDYPFGFGGEFVCEVRPKDGTSLQDQCYQIILENPSNPDGMIFGTGLNFKGPIKIRDLGGQQSQIVDDFANVLEKTARAFYVNRRLKRHLGKLVAGQ